MNAWSPTVASRIVGAVVTSTNLGRRRPGDDQRSGSGAESLGEGLVPVGFVIDVAVEFVEVVQVEPVADAVEQVADQCGRAPSQGVRIVEVLLDDRLGELGGDQ